MNLSHPNLRSFSNPFLAHDFAKGFRCAACWGTLVNKKGDDDTVTVVCEDCGDTTPGYVSQKYVESRQQKDLAEAMEARDILWKFMPHSGRSEKQIISDLGF